MPPSCWYPPPEAPPASPTSTWVPGWWRSACHLNPYTKILPPGLPVRSPPAPAFSAEVPSAHHFPDIRRRRLSLPRSVPAFLLISSLVPFYIYNRTAPANGCSSCFHSQYGPALSNPDAHGINPQNTRHSGYAVLHAHRWPTHGTGNGSRRCRLRSHTAPYTVFPGSRLY